MRTLNIHRKPKPAGALLPYWIITKVSRDAYMKLLRPADDVSADTDEDGFAAVSLNNLGTKINNGEIIELAISDDVVSFFVTNGSEVSNEIHLDASTNAYEIDTVGGFHSASCPHVIKNTISYTKRSKNEKRL